MGKKIALAKSDSIKLYAYLFQAYRSVDRSLNSDWTQFDKFYQNKIYDFIDYFNSLSIKIPDTSKRFKNKYEIKRTFRKIYYHLFEKKNIFFTPEEWLFIHDTVTEFFNFVLVNKAIDPIKLRMQITSAFYLIEELYAPKRHLTTAKLIESHLHPFHWEKLATEEILSKCGF